MNLGTVGLLLSLARKRPKKPMRPRDQEVGEMTDEYLERIRAELEDESILVSRVQARSLLAEVDRLTAEVKRLSICDYCGDELPKALCNVCDNDE